MIPIGPYLVSFESLEAMLYAQEFNSRKNLEYAFKIHEIIGKKNRQQITCLLSGFSQNFQRDPPNTYAEYQSPCNEVCLGFIICKC